MNGRSAWIWALIIFSIVMSSVLEVARTSEDVDDIKSSDCVSQPRHGESVPAGLRDRAVTGTEKILVICIDFSDMPAEKTTGYFESLVFGSSNSLKKYYEEVSYGQLTISGSIAGSTWVRAPHSHDWYGDEVSEGDDDENGPAWKIAKDAINAANAYVDFSSFDSNSDGTIQEGEVHIMVVAAGDPQSQTGVASDLWPHRWTIYDSSFKCDGVYLGGSGTCGYTLVTENTPMGTFAHEFGHDIGLPDLYDTSYSNNGLGRWCLMSSGNHLDSGNTPAHPSAWCKLLLGWLTPTVINANILSQPVKNVETNKDVLKLPISTTEYFLIENRQKTAFDSALPGSGIMIWHVDDSVGSFSSNDLQHTTSHKRVDLEEADNYGLDDKADKGTSTDPWYSGNTVMPSGFTYSSKPSSTKYGGANSGWAITNFTSSSNTMTISIKGPFTNTVMNPGDTPVPMQDGDAYISSHNTAVRDNDTNGADETLEASFTVSANKTVNGYVKVQLLNSAGTVVDSEITSKLLISSGVPLTGKLYVATSSSGYHYATISLLDEQYNMRDEVKVQNVWLETAVMGSANEEFTSNSYALSDENGDGLNDTVGISYTAHGDAYTGVKVKFECFDSTSAVIYTEWSNGTLDGSGDRSGAFSWTSETPGNEYYAAAIALYDSSDNLEAEYFAAAGANESQYFILGLPFLEIVYDETYARDLDGNGGDDTLYLYYELDTNLLSASFITEISAWNNSGDLVATGEDYFEIWGTGDENLTRVAWFMCYIAGTYKVSIKVKTYEPDDVINVSKESTYAPLTPIDKVPKLLGCYPNATGRLNPGEWNYSVNILDLDTPEIEMSFVWSLDGVVVSTANCSNATITIPETGTHSVSVIFSDGETTLAQYWNGTVNARPTVTLNAPSIGRPGDSVKFTASGTDSDGTIAYYMFDFGDGNFSGWKSTGSAEHTYSKAGTYSVRAQTSDSEGAVSFWSPVATVTIEEGGSSSWGLLACGVLALVIGVIVIVVIVVVVLFLFLVIRKKKTQGQ